MRLPALSELVLFSVSFVRREFSSFFFARARFFFVVFVFDRVGSSLRLLEEDKIGVVAWLPSFILLLRSSSKGDFFFIVRRIRDSPSNNVVSGEFWGSQAY